MIRSFIRRFEPRAWSNDELRRLAPRLPAGASIVNVSGWRDLDKEGARYRDYFRTPKVYHVTNYGSDSARGDGDLTSVALDLSHPLPADLRARYDIAFHHTVLEHVPDPVFAFAQISALTSDLAISVVPFKQKLHFEAGIYGDYYRFSPFAMRRLYAENGFTVLYESFTPRPALDVYLLHVASRFPERHAQLGSPPVALETLHQKVGSYSAKDLALNIAARLLDKYVARSFGTHDTHDSE